jgi:hemoglobin
MKLICILTCNVLLLLACASPPPPKTLYSQLGGLGTIENIAHAFIYELRKNDDVYPFFEDSSIERFRGSFIKHICRVSEGPCGYQKKIMPYVHSDSDIGDIVYDEKVEVLVDAMSTVGVSYRLQKILLKRLAPIPSESSYVSR